MKKIKSIDEIPAVHAYLRRVQAEARSLRTAVVTEKSGKYWKDVCEIKFDTQSGKVTADKAEYAPTESEQIKIAEEITQYVFPSLQLLDRLVDLPEEIAKAPAKNLFEFRNTDGKIVMLQVRIDLADNKKYIPWTYWDDGEWRKMEPDGKLPLYGLDQLNDHTTVFIHEGAKAARAVREMVEARTPEMKAKLAAHPWGEELKGAAHLGWIGGAMSPHRTDWSMLKRMGVKRAYIVSDNDVDGVRAVPGISYQLKMSTFHVQFTQDWPASFDLADEFPASMFSLKEDGNRYYIGPSFRTCLHPATWATDTFPAAKGGKPMIVLRDNFKDMWAYVEEVDMYVCIEMPEIIRTEQVMNKMLAKFSHTNSTSTYMQRAYAGRAPKLCYRPDVKGRVVSDRTTAAINLHTPTHIKSTKGDPKPFLDFISYLIPLEAERREVLKWCATLIARPEVRMHYALLMVSQKQGMGKTTLGERILGPLVGDQNVSYPQESEIVDSAFNPWIANKRLVIVGEIYSGHSWKAYNKLKGLITDWEIQVNEKYMRPYRIENWAHFYVCSNSRRALKMEDDDRRWYYPTLTETAWPRERFATLNNWLRSGGLGIIKWWAENYGEYVYPGARAPMTNLKQELIEASRSDAQKEVADLGVAMGQEKQPIGFAMKEIEAWVRSNIQGRVFDSDHELRKTMVEVGCFVYPDRIKVGGRLQYVVMNSILKDNVAKLEARADQAAEIRKCIKKPNEVITESM